MILVELPRCLVPPGCTSLSTNTTGVNVSFYMSQKGYVVTILVNLCISFQSE